MSDINVIQSGIYRHKPEETEWNAQDTENTSGSVDKEENLKNPDANNPLSNETRISEVDQKVNNFRILTITHNKGYFLQILIAVTF